MDLERRFATGATVEGRQLIGLAAPFGVETRIADFREVIAPGAFTKTIYVRFTPAAVQDYSGNITLTLSGSTLGSVAVSGAGVAAGAGMDSFATWFTAGAVLTPVTDGDRTFVEWSAEFDCPPEREADLIANIGGGVFQGGFDALKRAFGG